MPDTDPNTPNDTPSRRKRLMVRSAKALLAAAGLICLQWLGDAVVARTGWPVPGALVGLLLLLGGLVVWGRVPPALDDVSTPLLRHLMLLLIPSVAAVPLIEDDVYGELHAGTRRPPPAKAFDKQGGVLHCSSFSKCLAPGYRVGWAAAGRYAAQVERLKMMTSLATAIPSQLALADYLAQGGYDRHLRRLREALAAQRVHALNLVERHFPAGTRVTRPEGGYFLWLELPPEVDALALHQRAKACSISTAPGVLFSADHRFTHHLRLNVGHPGDARFDGAIKLLGKLAVDLQMKPN
jgi:DNA-binding transcriptional MocR family regulator